MFKSLHIPLKMIIFMKNKGHDSGRIARKNIDV